MNPHARTQTTVLFSLLLGLAAYAPADPAKPDIANVIETQNAFTAVAKKAMPAVVFIEVEKEVTAHARGHQPSYNDPFDFFGDDLMRRFFGPEARPRQPQQPRQPQRRFRQQGAGSGFIITKDGYILTNSHVVGDADRIRVKLHDGRTLDAKLVGSDPKSEVAVIKIDAKNLPTVELGHSDALEIGQWVIAIGNPFGLSETLTVGVVSAMGRAIGLADYEDFIQTDAAINPGNSGGPLLNIHGQVIGINTAIYSQSGGYMGIGFAIPIDMARHIKDQLVKDGRVSRGYLGVYIQDIDDELADAFGLEGQSGILVTDVEEEGPADHAGIKPDDIILKANGQDVESVTTFRNSISSRGPAREVELTIQRSGKQLTIEATTGVLPGSSVSDEEIRRAVESIGIEVDELSDDIADRLNVELDAGILIVSVQPGSPAARSGIRPGAIIVSVNLQRVESIEAFEEAMAAAQESGRAVLKILMGSHHRYIPFTLD
jgi:serine protease Do